MNSEPKFKFTNLLLLFFLFVVIDIVVISYNRQMWTDLQSVVGAPNVSLMHGLIAWFLLVLGMYLFILPKINTIGDSIIWGSIYALIVYGVFDFTNMAIFPNIYTWEIAGRDILSGMISTVLALLAYISIKS
jgi:uncharacterized membrane protein